MGTRSLTFVYTGNEPVLCMYAQWDGYPSGHGRDLAQFLSSFDAIVNGLNINETRRVANGMDCLAAQLIAHFKKGAGDFYIYPINCGDCGQEYEYHIYENKVVIKDCTDEMFTGTWQEFMKFCTKKEMA